MSCQECLCINCGYEECKIKCHALYPCNDPVSYCEDYFMDAKKEIWIQDHYHLDGTRR